MKKYLLILMVILMCIQVQAQKDKKQSRIPSIRQNYQRFSVFAYENDSYLHKETNNVWMETFLEIKSKENMVILPGLGDKQSCSYSIPECQFYENEEDLQLIVIPIECATPEGAVEKRVLRIHYVTEGRKLEYIYSLSFMEAKDLVLFHNFSDQKLGQLLSKNLIRFE